MKKVFALMLATLLCLGVLAGCGGGNTQAHKDVQTAWDAMVKDYNSLGEFMAKIEEAGLELNPEATASYNATSDVLNQYQDAIAAGWDKLSEQQLKDIKAAIETVHAGVIAQVAQLQGELEGMQGGGEEGGDEGGEEEYEEE